LYPFPGVVVVPPVADTEPPGEGDPPPDEEDTVPSLPVLALVDLNLAKKFFVLAPVVVFEKYFLLVLLIPIL
jgi:hypothetical protein|tara:strand:+ start:761 stop:976 length:216 start_codon:yes stop_codon:yes gene_type:complete